MHDTIADHIDEGRRRAFESAWSAGSPTRIEENLPAADRPEYLPTLEELVHIELEFAWKQARAGGAAAEAAGPLVESYLARFPPLLQPNIVRRLVQQEFHVRRACGSRPAINEYCRRFPELWSNPSEAGAFLLPTEAGPLETNQAAPAEARYHLVAKHARGGFGEVWRAADSVLNRDIAIKRLAPALASEAEYRRRFAEEARITGQLEHPGVVPVYDLVDAGSEHPYYVMRFLGGTTMADAVHRFHQAHPAPSFRSVAGLRLLTAFLTIAKTIQFAHARGVIHRDLKPQNVMLGDFGETIILDWGLAKYLSADRPIKGTLQAGDGDPAGNRQTDEHVQTMAGAVMGTPAYMSPEQFAGRTGLVDQRSDIYGLGAILYETLTGRPPHGEAAHLAKSRGPVRRPRALAASIPRSLEAICLKSLAPDQADRYQEVAAMTRDLELYLADEPVSVLRESWPARLARYARRHRNLMATGGLVGLSVLLALAGILAVVVKSNRDLGLAQAETAAALVEAEDHLYLQRLVTAHQEFMENHNVVQAEALLDLCPPSRRQWEWHFVKGLCDRDQPGVLRGHQGRVQSVAVSPDDRLAASVDDEGTVIVWDIEQAERRWRGSHQPAASCLAFAPDGRQLVTGGRDADGRGNVKIWDVASGELLRQHVVHGRAVTALAFAPDGRRLATAGADETVTVWDAATGQLERTLRGHAGAVLAVAFAPDSGRLASGGQDTVVRTWDLDTGDPVREFAGHTAPVTAVAFNMANGQLASASQDSTIRLWPSDAMDGVRVLTGHREAVECLAFSDDGRKLASAGFDASIRVWDLERPDTARVLRGHESHIRGVAMRADAGLLFSAADDFTVRLWDIERSPAATFAGQMVAFSPTGRRFATADVTSGRRSVVRLWEPESHQERLRLATDARVTGLVYSQDGRHLATAETNGAIAIRDAYDGTVVERIDCGTLPLGLALSPDNRQVIAGDPAGVVRIWNRESNAPPRIIRAHADRIAATAFSPDALTIATASVDGTGKLFDARTGEEQALLRGHHKALTQVVFSPDGTRVATSSFDGTIRLWNRATGEPLMTLTAGKFYLNSVVFSPDGRRIVSGSDQMIKIWDADTGHQVFSLWGHNCVSQLAFDPRGEWLAVAGTHKHVRLLRGSSVSGPR